MKPIYKILIAILFLALSFGLWFIFSKEETPITPSSTQNTATAKDFKIVAFGDSLTAGYNLPASESYPAELESRLSGLGFSVQVINSGVSGETTRGNLERAPFIRSQNPEIVLLGIGGNDALRSLPVTETKKNMAETIRILQSGTNPPTVLLLQMQSPLNSGFAYKQSFDAIYPSLASTYNTPLVAFLTEEIFLNSSNLLSDGIHLNKKGYAEAVEKHILPAVIENLPK